ncbi:PEGA domain-containing protein [Bordetella petrii]|uniref:PEGA domain-containing protein n=1 Tax=Bordetella petrii TaxID=94624 RepID=UPI002E75B7EF|nr:PEGA domain-containing protein [Bordetella petrii]
MNVRPWGEILVNGVSRGVTPPLKTLRLPPGKYSVTVRNSAQAPYRTTLEVRAGKPAMITHVFR